MLRQAEAANEAHIAAFEALGELGTSGLSQGHGGVGPGPRVIPPKYPSGPPPPPPPPSGPPEAPGGGVPEPSGPPPPSVVSARDDPSNPNNRLKTGWKNRMCALITALDMNLTERVKALCDEFLENNEIQVFVCAEALCCSYKYKQHYAFNMFYYQLQLEYFLVCNKLQIQIALCFQYVLSPITTGVLFGWS